uniref:Reverse transcriptase domain-containing protein n=1 Tax=Micrurus paraensis TaxID=1970185 RepID=A0A2D4L702_9SAUR
MDFGQKFLNVLVAIYDKQQAKILINDHMTDKLEIQKGMRQGYPLSPLLFILTLETQTRIIRKEPEIKGLKNREEYKLQTFADDLVFILEDPENSGPKLIEKLEEFGKVVGLKINRKKTKILTNNMTKIQKENLTMVMDIQVTNKIFGNCNLGKVYNA